jgi:5-formyltetrahydrofolate cyclo-ligase
MSEIVSEAKKALRVQILANRTDVLAKQTSGPFAESLLALSLMQNLKRIGCYLSFGSEPATDSFIELATAEGIEIACPRIDANGQMVMAVLDSGTTLSALGFREPQGKVIEPKDLDLIVVPALAIDYKGQRLGRGAGYFDRYLQHYKGPTVGLIYDSEFLPVVPSLSHDKPVSQVVTEARTIGIPFAR